MHSQPPCAALDARLSTKRRRTSPGLLAYPSS